MAALIDASTGYNVITDYGDDNLEDPFSAANFDAATGPQPYDDFFESNSAEDNLDSGSSLEHPKLLQPIQAIVWDVGATVYRNIYIKTFEDSTAPRLSFSTSFAYLFALILTWIIEFYSTLSFHAANTKSSPRLMLATLSSVGTLLSSYAANRILTAAISFSGNLANAIYKTVTAALSFVADFVSDLFGNFFVTMTSTLSFHGTVLNGWSMFWSEIWVRIKSALQELSGGVITLARRGQYFSTEESVSTTPITITVSEANSIVFVNNLDDVEFVEVDSSASFDQFPQRIPPKSGVYLTPSTPGTFYIRSTGVSDVQIIAGGSASVS